MFYLIFRIPSVFGIVWAQPSSQKILKNPDVMFESRLNQLTIGLCLNLIISFSILLGQLI